MNYKLSHKAKIRAILEKLGYKYYVFEEDSSLGVIKGRYMINEKYRPSTGKHMFPLDTSKDVVWAICAMVSEKIPHFIDLVYPFPSEQWGIIDKIYEFYFLNEQNQN